MLLAKLLIKNLFILSFLFINLNAIAVNANVNISITNESDAKATVTSSDVDKIININTSSETEVRLFINEDLYQTKTSDTNGDLSFTISGIDFRAYNNKTNTIDIKSYVNNEENLSTSFDLSVTLQELNLDVHGGALQFKGSNESYVSLPEITDTVQTVEFWLKRHDDICGVGSVIENSNIKISDSLINGQCYVNIYMYGSYLQETSIAINNNEWTHFSFIYDNNQENIDVYINGVKGTLTLKQEELVEAEASNIKLGLNSKYTIDDLKLWSKIKTEAQAINTYNRQVNVNNNSEIDNLLLYYNFDEGYGTTVKDLSGNNNNGTINGDTQRLNFLDSNLSFANISSAVSVGSTTPEKLINLDTNELTISAWVNINNTIDGEVQLFGNANYYSLILDNTEKEDNSNVSIKFNIKKDTFQDNIESTYNFEKGKWYYITSSFDNGLMKLYVNNTELLTKTSTVITELGKLILDDDIQKIPHDTFLIGSKVDTSDKNYNGLIAEVNVWKKALSTLNIQNSMYTAINLEDENLLAYWKLTEGRDNLIYDNSNNTKSPAYFSPTVDLSSWIQGSPIVLGNHIYKYSYSYDTYKINAYNIDESLQYSEDSSYAEMNGDYLRYKTLSSSLSEDFTITGSNDTDETLSDYYLNVNVTSYKYGETPTLGTTTLNIDENLTNLGKLNILTEGDSVITNYYFTGSNTDLFEIDTEGYLLVKDTYVLDYEDRNNYSFNVVLQNKAGNSNVANISISVKNLDDEVPVLKETIVTVEENSSEIGNIDIEYIGDTPITSYQLSEDSTANFNIDDNGLITTKDSYVLDYEEQEQLTIGVLASNEAGTSEAKKVIVNITNQLEQIPVLASEASYTVDENSNQDTVIGSLDIESTGDSEITGYLLNGTNSDYFEINSSTKQIILKSKILDYETTPIFNLSLTASNQKGESLPQSLTINVVDLIDVQAELNDISITVDNTIEENSIIDTIIPIKGDSDIIKYVHTGTGADDFTISNNGEISTTTNFDSNNQTKYEFELSVFDSLGESQKVSLNIDLYKNIAPSIASVYDEYLEKNFSNKSISVNLNDDNNDSLSVTVTVEPEDIFTVSTSNSILTSDDYENFTINLESINNSLGKATITLNVSDSAYTTSSTFDVIVENTFKLKKVNTLLNDTEYQQSSTINLNTGMKFYSFENNIGYNFSPEISNTSYSSYEVIDENTFEVIQYTDTDGEVTKESTNFIYFSNEDSQINLYSDKNKEDYLNSFKLIDLSKSEVENILSSIDNPYTFSSSDANGYKILQTQITSSLDLKEVVDYHGTKYTSLMNFMEDFIVNKNTLGLVRSYDKNKMILLDTNISNKSGDLVSIDVSTKEEDTTFNSSWELIDDGIKEILYLGEIDGFEDNIAFALDENGYVSRGTYTKKDSYSSELLLNKSAKKEIYNLISNNPYKKQTINTKWTYLSLSNKIVLCNAETQASLSQICNDENTLESVFGNESIEYVYTHNGQAWTYWNNTNDLTLNSLNKFSSLSHKNGLLIKLKDEVTQSIQIKLPFIEEENDTDGFVELIDNKNWYLVSLSDEKSISEIENLISDKNKELENILVYRNDVWEVYSPDDQYLDSTIKRIDGNIKENEAFWINIKN